MGTEAKATIDRQALARRARRLDLQSRRRVAHLFAGEARSVFRGAGLEFESVREYAYGDDVRAIDWNVTARVGRPFVKRFIATRDRDVLLAIDRSPSMEFGPATTKAEQAALLALFFALLALRGRERVGLFEFACEQPAALPPSRTADVPERLLAVLARQVRPLARDSGLGLEAMAQRLDRALPRRALLLIASDFEGLAPSDEHALGRLAARHEVLAARIHDPREASLDGVAGRIEAIDPESGRRFAVDGRCATTRRDFAHVAAAARRSALEALDRAGIERFESSTRDASLSGAIEFLIRRARGAER
jgi:uncharacterized protein (DUF58 family)